MNDFQFIAVDKAAWDAYVPTLPPDAWIDEIGAVYEVTGIKKQETIHGTIEVPTVRILPGYYVNVRYVELPPADVPKILIGNADVVWQDPTLPEFEEHRVWAGGNIPYEPTSEVRKQVADMKKQAVTKKRGSK